MRTLAHKEAIRARGLLSDQERSGLKRPVAPPMK
jgi:hypothetical protein